MDVSGNLSPDFPESFLIAGAYLMSSIFLYDLNFEDFYLIEVTGRIVAWIYGQDSDCCPNIQYFIKILEKCRVGLLLVHSRSPYLNSSICCPTNEEASVSLNKRFDILTIRVRLYNRLNS